MLKDLKPFTARTAKKATAAPVFLKVGNFRDKTKVAHLVKHDATRHGKARGVPPVKYVVVFGRRFIGECREKGPACKGEMKEVIAHELAHIKHPHVHGVAFQRECRRLGGGNRCVARGIEGKSKSR